MDRTGVAARAGALGAVAAGAGGGDGLRRSLVLTFGIALAGGLVLALLTIVYTLRLERELERRLDENARARTHILQKLGLHSVPELILYAVRKSIIA